MMKFKNLLQVLVALVVAFGAVGAQAQALEPVVIVRDLTYWDATYAGYVDANRFEKWPIIFTEAEDFSVTAAPGGAGLTTLILLLDSSGVEIARGSGVLTSSQPAGSYYVQVQPETGSGFYSLTIRRVELTPDPDSSASAETSNLKVGESTLISVSLNNVPAEGYTSAEFACTYDPTALEASNVVFTDLFGADSATVFTGSTGGKFIAAVAGSNGAKATASGVALTFSVKALKAGETTVSCVARVSQGDNVLTELASTPVTLTVTDVVVVVNGTLTGQVLAGKPVTVNLYDATDALVATVAANADGTFSLTAPAGTYTVVATASGFLSAEGSATVVAEQSVAMPTVTLLAGDIDGNNVVDQFDALTIGMSYNTAAPAAADLNNDGNINVLDLELLAANYRLTGPIAWQ